MDHKKRSLSGIIISDDRDEGVRQTSRPRRDASMSTLTTFDLSFKLKNGSLQRWERQADTYRSLSFQDYTFSLNLASLIPNREWRKRPYEMDINELRKAFRTAKAEDRYEFTLEIYKKFSVPCSVVAFMLLTVPLGIREEKRREVLGGRLQPPHLHLLLYSWRPSWKT